VDFFCIVHCRRLPKNKYIEEEELRERRVRERSNKLSAAFVVVVEPGLGAEAGDVEVVAEADALSGGE